MDDRNSLNVWSSDFGCIDISQFSHLKFRKDGWFDGRRKEEYYLELKEHIMLEETKLIKGCESAWDSARISQIDLG